MKKNIIALFLTLGLSASAFAELPPKNQYGGYDNVEQLTLDQYNEFKETPRYKEVIDGLIKQMQEFDSKSQAAVQGDKVGEIPQIPELTVEQKSFLTKNEIESWNIAREKVKNLEKVIGNINQKAQEVEQKADALKEAVNKNEITAQQAKSMLELPDQMDDSFTRDANGKLIYTPKIDMKQLPELKMPEANCDLLDGKTK